MSRWKIVEHFKQKWKPVLRLGNAKYSKPLSKSVARVRAEAARLGIAIEIVERAHGTRTAADAAIAVGCLVDQIIKSIVFRGKGGGEHFLFLTAGNNQVDAAKAAFLCGVPLEKADADSIRAATGFVIGGVAPLGHIQPIRTWMDPHILDFAMIWAAAGTPNHVFSVDPRALRAALGPTLADFTV